MRVPHKISAVLCVLASSTTLLSSLVVPVQAEVVRGSGLFHRSYLPCFCVTFNRKDFERYASMYPDIIVFFWVDWKQLSYKEFSTNHLAGVFKVDFSKLREMVEAGSPEHAYLRRINDKAGNAKTSFLFDVRKMSNLMDLVQDPTSDLISKFED